MRLHENIDFTTLTWVKPELDETLRQARNALQNYVEEGERPAELRNCADLLHQVQGTLRMVELYGAAMVAEEMEQLAKSLIDARVADRDNAYAVLMQGIVQLPDYLERLQSGHRDIPIVLLPLLNQLRESRGEKGLNESVLFSPDLSRPLPDSANGPTTPLAQAELGRRAEALRGLYQGALLRWLKDDNSPATIRDLTDVCEQLVPITSAEPARRLFWVAAGTLDALAKNAFPISNPLKQALAKVEREIKRLADGGDAAFRNDPPIELTKQLLYFVAHEGSDTGRIGEIRNVFGLSGGEPSEAELAHARGSLSGNNRALLETVGVAIKEDLLRVKDALDLHLRTPGTSPADLGSQVEALDRVADTLGMLGLGVPRRVVQDQRNAINDVVTGQRKDNEDTLLDIAGALLYVEAALDDQVERLGKDETPSADGAESGASNESRRLLEVLVKEAIVNFSEARQCFVAFVETHWDHAQLAQVPRLLTEVSGALRILNIPAPADYLIGIRQFTDNELLRRRHVPNGQQMDRLADALASLEYFLEALRDRRPNREQILEVARQSLAALGYWPLTAEMRAAAPMAATVTVAPVVAPASPVAPAAALPVKAPVAEPVPVALAPADQSPAVSPPAPPAAGVPPPEAQAPVVALESAAASASITDAPVLVPAAAMANAGQPVPGFDGESSEEIDDEIREVFLEEFEEEIDNLAQLLPTWRADPTNAELLRPIRRVFHTLKGSGRLVGAKTLGEFSWKVESLLNRVLDGSRPASLQVLALIQLSLENLPLLRAALQGEQVSADLAGIQLVAEQLASGEEVSYVPAGQAPVEATVPVEVPDAAPVIAEAEAGLAESVLAPAGPVFSIDPVLLEILKPEVAGHLEVVDAWLANCARLGPQQVTDLLVRSIHTMNGAFAMTEVMVITDVTAPLEGFVKRSLAHQRVPDATGIALVADAAQAIRATILAIEKPRPVLPHFESLAARALALRDSLPDSMLPSVPMHVDDEAPVMPQVVVLEAADVSAIPSFERETAIMPALDFPIAVEAETVAADNALAEQATEEAQPVEIADPVVAELATMETIAAAAPESMSAEDAAFAADAEAFAANIDAAGTESTESEDIGSFIEEGPAIAEPSFASAEEAQAIAELPIASELEFEDATAAAMSLSQVEGEVEPEQSTSSQFEEVAFVTAEEAVAEPDVSLVPETSLEDLSAKTLEPAELAFEEPAEAQFDFESEFADAEFVEAAAFDMPATDETVQTAAEFDGSPVQSKAIDEDVTEIAGFDLLDLEAEAADGSASAEVASGDPEANAAQASFVEQNPDGSLEEVESGLAHEEIVSQALPDLEESASAEAESLPALDELPEESIAYAEIPEGELLSLEAFLRGDDTAAGFVLDEVPLEFEPETEATVESDEVAPAQESAVAEMETLEVEPAEAGLPDVEVAHAVDSATRASHTLPAEEELLDYESAFGEVSSDFVEAATPAHEDVFQSAIPVQQRPADELTIAATPDAVTEEPVSSMSDSALASMIAAYAAEEAQEVDAGLPQQQDAASPLDSGQVFEPLASDEFILDAPDPSEPSEASPAPTAIDDDYYGMSLDELEALTSPATFMADASLASAEASPQAATSAEAVSGEMTDNEADPVEADGFLDLPSISQIPAWVGQPQTEEPGAALPESVEVHAELPLSPQAMPEPEDAQAEYGFAVEATEPDFAEQVHAAAATVEHATDHAADFVEAAEEVAFAAEPEVAEEVAEVVEPEVGEDVVVAAEPEVAAEVVSAGQPESSGAVENAVEPAVAEAAALEPQPEIVEASIAAAEPETVNDAELLFQDDEDELDVVQIPVAADPVQAFVTRPNVPIASDPADPNADLDLTDLDTELLDLFLEESNDLLDHSDGMLARLRDRHDDRESISNLQRDLHTLKGGARMAGIFAVGDLGHAMESLLEAVAEGRQNLDSVGVVVLERGFDRLHGMVARIGERKAIALPAGLIAQVEALAEGKSLSEAAIAAEQTEAVVPTSTLLPKAVVATGLNALSAPLDEAVAEDEMTGVRAPQEQVRIRADLLDRLVNYAGEVAIYRARLEQQLGAFRSNLGELNQTTNRLREQLRRLDIETEAQIVARYQREGESNDESFDPLELDRFTNQQQLTRGLNESANDLVNLQTVLDELTRQYETLLLQQSRVSSDLQEGLMRTRMVPFDALVPRLRRVLRQAATDTGKQVQLKVDGASGEMDRNVLDRMTAPLEHMLRNAMAHGLELPEERRKQRKAEEGIVRIAVHREGSEVVLKVSDDGRGLDKAAIHAKALERGLIKADAEISDEALYGLILESGFSTAETISRLSGRGVGMDVVYSEIRQLGGTLQIRSEQGKGSEFIIRLPFTLAVTQAVFVKIGDTSFAVPIASVQGVGRIARADLEKQLAGENPVFSYAGEDYAIHDLGTLIGHAPAKAQDSLQMPLLLARSGDLRTAISIDQVLGSREIVVKPVGPQVNSVPGIFGATIMGDGRVVVILDVAPLVRRQSAIVRDMTPVQPVAVVAAHRVPVVMVVDDSITMRKVTGRVLERNNMEVMTAKDGVDAVEKMAERVPDLVLLDIEMPRMDGYEVAQNMKSDPRLKDVPIIMITSRTGEKHRQRAMEIGVDRYLGKPYQEPELMRNVFEMLGLEAVNG